MLMEQKAKRSAEFWIELERNVSALVDAALHKGEITYAPLVTYLRDLETMSRAECDRRQTVQIIASGRRLLGDQTVLGPHETPFTRALA
jgi:hypothetical protein